MHNCSVTRWIQALKNGSDEAAERIWERYIEDLLKLARRKLSGSPRRVADEEDVVASAFASLCRGAADGRFTKLRDRQDLWQLMVMIASRKASNQRKHAQRQKRGADRVRGESVLGEDANDRVLAELAVAPDSQPTPEAAAEVAETCRRILDELDSPALQSVFLRKLEGYTNDEIAQKAGCSTRTVERKWRLIRKKAEEVLSDERPPSSQ